MIDTTSSSKDKSLAILYKLKRFMLDRIDITAYYSTRFNIVFYDKTGHAWHIATKYNRILDFIAYDIAYGTANDTTYRWLQEVRRRPSTTKFGIRYKATLPLDDYAVIYDFVKNYAVVHNGLKLISIVTHEEFNFFEAYETAESIAIEWDLISGKTIDEERQ